MKFYTNVQVGRGKILYRGIENGHRVKKRINYAPTLYLKSQDGNGTYKTLTGDQMSPVNFSSISDARKFLQNYPNEVFGQRRFEYTWMNDNSPSEWDRDLIRVFRIDIEVASEDGFPEPNHANEEVTAITVKCGAEYHVFVSREYTPHRPDIVLHRADDESELLHQFMNWWMSDYPDVVTGWNINGFDIPYLMNRIEKLFGEEVRDAMSPWNNIYRTTTNNFGKDVITFVISGIAILDSIDLYKKLTLEGKSRDSYRLDSIGEVEGLGQKMDYQEYGNLHTLYKVNYQKYVEYNVRDVELDEAIANKYDLINLAFTISYMNNVNYEDVFMQVRMWTAIVDNTLKKDNIVLNHGVHNDKTPFEGAFVLDPQIGLFKHVGSFDLTSLYPHLIMQYGISPETLVQQKDYTPEQRAFVASVTLDKLLNREIDTSCLKKWGMSVTPNGQLFRTDVQGFLPKLMEDMFKARAENKKHQLEAENELELIKDEMAKRGLL